MYTHTFYQLQSAYLHSSITVTHRSESSYYSAFLTPVTDFGVGTLTPVKKLMTATLD